MIISPLPTYGYKLYAIDIYPHTDRQPIQIQNQSVIISQKIQQELASQIPQLDLQLQSQFKLFSVPLNREISLVYAHQGRNHWHINFQYGGYPIDTKDRTIYTTEEIYRIKQAFTLTKKIDIAGRIYNTNGSMRQIGPILHSRGTGC
jgi:hypothetical protein